MASESIFVKPRSGIIPLTSGYRLPDGCPDIALINQGSGPPPTLCALCAGTSLAVYTESGSVMSSCPMLPATTCYPPTISGALAYTFSPASQCPGGWTAAAGATLGVDGSSSSEWNFKLSTDRVNEVLSPGESMIICCPTGYSKTGDPTDPCSSQITPSQTIIAVNYVVDTPTCLISRTTYTQPAQTATLEVIPIGLFYHPTPSDTAAAPGQISTSQASPGTASTSQSNDTSNGISQGSIIGIGISIPLAILCAVALVALLLWRWRRLKGSRSNKSTDEKATYEKPELDNHERKRIELESQNFQKVAQPVFELEEPFSQPTRQEMAS